MHSGWLENYINHHQIVDRIGPGVLISENFDITYGLGHLTIVPETLTVTARDTLAGCNGLQPVYSSGKTFY